MPPLLAHLAIRRHGVRLNLWLPLFLLWLLLLPVALVLAPFAIVGLVAARINPFRAIGATVAVLSNLSGTMIDVARRDGAVFIRIV